MDKNNKPLISIIIPTYNRAHLISKTLNSFIAQTYLNWECIIVDDGSLDNTETVLKEYSKKDARFRYYQRPKHKKKGANACRNYGFEKSRGKYINWFDSDDFMKPNKLEIQIEELHNSSYDYTICQSMMFDVKTNKEIGLRAPRLISDNIFEDYILFKSFWLIEAPLWKKDFLAINSLFFDEELQQAQDYDFHIRVLLVSQNFNINNTPLVIVNQHEENMSNSNTNSINKIVSNVKVTNEILKTHRNKLSSFALKTKYKGLLKLYKSCLKQNKIKASFFLLQSLIQNVIILEVSSYQKFKLVVRLCLALITYSIFSKGEGFLRFNN